MKSPTHNLKFFFLLLVLVFSPVLTAQTYTLKNSPIGGGGYVTGIVSHSSGDRYCRTDVGGAYRWDVANNKWIQLLDWINESENGFYGVDALAIDPQNGNNVYMLCGLDYSNNGRTAILKSTDKGNTFTYTDVTAKFKTHGNGNGRGNGERLAVDPKNSNILFCGTRANGLWKSTDGGVSWNQAWNGVTTTANGNGICFVQFDPSSSVVNGASQTIYIGVSRTGGGNIYKSTNGGVSFTDISPNTGFMPHRVALQGTTMYATLSIEAGPAFNINNYENTTPAYNVGRVYKLNTSTGAWTNVSPVEYPTYAYGGVSIDPKNVNRVMISTCGMYWNKQYGTQSGDLAFLSTDGGSTWTLKNGSNATYNNNGMAWTNGTVNWMDCVEFDPVNSSIVRAIGGGGVYTCSDIAATNPSWKYDVIGIEEAGMISGISIPGGPFISTFGDITGFVHNDLTSSPASTHQPADGSNWSIAYATANTNKIVRVGSNNIYYSNDKGTTWTATATNKGDVAQSKVAISADGGTTLNIPHGSATTYYTTNDGASWSSCSGVSTKYITPVADPVNSNYFYIYDPTNGQMLSSSNKGISFSVAGTPGTNPSGSWLTIRTAPGLEGHIWVPLGSNGLKYSTDHGATYTTLANVSYCTTVGIGKAIAGANYPTLFIWGTVSGVTGLFRSTDKGATWGARMNDDAHEFGGASTLIGDMNVDGRVFMSANGTRGLHYWDACSPTTISPWAQVNGGSWQQTATATLAPGGSLMFGPQPTTGGSWSWTGPNNFSATTREVSISNIQANQAGNYVATYTNSGGCQSSQTFTVTVSGSSIVTIANRATGLLIDGMGRTTAGSTCSQWASSGSWNQMWILETSGAYVYIKNRNTGLYIDGRGNSTNGSYVGQWSSVVSNNLQWQQETTGGYVKFKNRATGLYLDGMGNATNGADLAQWSSGGSYNQQWTITTVGSGQTAKMDSKSKDDIEEEPNFSINFSPNPFVNDFKIEATKLNEPIRVSIFDVLGRKVETAESSLESGQLLMGSSLKSGLYIVQVEGVNLNFSKTFKILKK